MNHPIYAKAIFFDAVGTLFRVRGGVGQIYWEVGKPFGVRAAPPEIEHVFEEVFREAPPLTFSRLQSGLLRRSEKEWWRNVVLKVFHRVGMINRFDDYFDELFRVFSGIRGWELYPDTRETLQALKKEGFILGIISNFDSRILTVCTDLEIFEYVDSIKISSREGVAKPDPEIFRRAAEQHGLMPREAVHVGDNLDEDVKGAQSAGMIPIFLDRSGRANPPEGILTVPRLAELLPSIRLL